MFNLTTRPDWACFIDTDITITTNALAGTYQLLCKPLPYIPSHFKFHYVVRSYSQISINSFDKTLRMNLNSQYCLLNASSRTGYFIAEHWITTYILPHFYYVLRSQIGINLFNKTLYLNLRSRYCLLNASSRTHTRTQHSRFLFQKIKYALQLSSRFEWTNHTNHKSSVGTNCQKPRELKVAMPKATMTDRIFLTLVIYERICSLSLLSIDIYVYM